MRESNFCLPQQNKASCVISTQFYDRKALDTKDSTSLINSLTNLQYLTSVSQKVRDIIAYDGGIDRLVKIMKWSMNILLIPGGCATPVPFLLPADRGSQPLQGIYDRQILYVWTLAFQCCVNIGVRGSEELRTKVVQAGVLDIASAILGTWKASMDRYRFKKIKEYQLQTLSIRAAWLAEQQRKTSHATTRNNTPDSTLLNDDSQLRSLGEVEMSPMPPAVPNSTPIFNEQSNTFNNYENTTNESNSRSSSVVQSEDDNEEQQQPQQSQQQPSSTFMRARSGTVVPSSQQLDITVNPQPTPANTPQVPSVQQPTPRPQPQPSPRALNQDNQHNHRQRSENIEFFRPEENTIYREEDVLLALQLLAYISKYPHIREGFQAPSRAWQVGRESFDPDENSIERLSQRDNYKKNLFYIVEAFTYEGHIEDPTSIYLPSEIRYWAGVTMRNACRKHEAFGGIRQCANVACGKWESSPKEFAKCRICRKAKYCSKECQSRAWRVGHRFWCQTRSDMTTDPESYVPPYLPREDQQTPRAELREPQPTSPLNTLQIPTQLNGDFENWTNVPINTEDTIQHGNIFEDEFTRRFTGIEPQPNPQNHFQLPPLRFDNQATTTPNDNVIGNSPSPSPAPPSNEIEIETSAPNLSTSISEGADERERRSQTQDYMPRTRSTLSEVLTIGDNQAPQQQQFEQLEQAEMHIDG